MVSLVNMIGAGNLGKTIGRLLVRQQLVDLGAVCNQSEASAIQALQFIGQGQYCPNILELPPADITFITTPDDTISTVCKELSQNSLLKKGSIILHCSGALTSDVLMAIKEKGCYVASVHPMRSFARPELSVDEYSGTYCAIEGDNEALPTIHALFNAIGSVTFEIDKTKKSLYHAAGVFASNYCVTLAQQALLCLQEVGVEHDMAIHLITTIMQSTVTNLVTTLSPKKSLTGPIQRADVSTILQHMAALSNIEQQELYSMLGKATLHLTDHSTVKKDQITTALVSQLTDT